MDVANDVAMELIKLRAQADELHNATLLFQQSNKQREKQEIQEQNDMNQLQQRYDSAHRVASNSVVASIPSLQVASWSETTLQTLYPKDWRQRLQQRERLVQLVPGLLLTPLRKTEAAQMYGEWLRRVGAVVLTLEDKMTVHRGPIRFLNKVLNDGDELVYFALVDGHSQRLNTYFVAKLTRYPVTVFGNGSSQSVLTIIKDPDFLSASLSIQPDKLTLGTAHVLSQNLLRMDSSLIF